MVSCVLTHGNTSFVEHTMQSYQKFSKTDGTACSNALALPYFLLKHSNMFVYIKISKERLKFEIMRTRSVFLN